MMQADKRAFRRSQPMNRWSLAAACLLLGGFAGSCFIAPVLHGQGKSAPTPPTLPRELTSYRDILKQVLPAGDRVLAVGAPFGLTGSVTHGIISGKARSGLNLNMYEDFLQSDAAISPGNSGGPLINLEGKIVGINAAIKSKGGGFQGVGLAVS